MKKFLIYNSRFDNIFLLTAAFSSIIAGLLLPSISYVVGSVSDTFGNGNNDAIISDMNTIIKYVCIIAFLLFLFTYVLFAFWGHAMENIIFRLRIKYLECLLFQSQIFPTPVSQY